MRVLTQFLYGLYDVIRVARLLNSTSLYITALELDTIPKLSDFFLGYYKFGFKIWLKIQGLECNPRRVSTSSRRQSSNDASLVRRHSEYIASNLAISFSN